MKSWCQFADPLKDLEPSWRMNNVRADSDQAKLDRITNWTEIAEEACYDPWLLAEKCTVSSRTLQRFFRARFDSTPHEFLVGVRQLKAEELARNGNRTKEI